MVPNLHATQMTKAKRPVPVLQKKIFLPAAHQSVHSTQYKYPTVNLWLFLSILLSVFLLGQIFYKTIWASISFSYFGSITPIFWI